MEKAVGQIHARPNRGPRSSACRSCSGPSTSAGRGPELFDLAEPIPGPTTERAGEGRAGRRAWSWSGRCSSSGWRGVPQHGRRLRRRRHPARALPQDAHPATTRCTSRSITSPPATWASGLRHPVRQGRHAGLLGPVVPGGGPADGAARGGGARSTRRPSAGTRGEGRVRQAAARRVGDDPAGPRDRQRRLRGGGQPRRPRAVAGRRRAGVLGGVVRRRPVRRRAGPRRRTPTRRLLVVPCDRGARLEDVRRNWPFFRDRRTDAYADLVKVGGD